MSDHNQPNTTTLLAMLVIGFFAAVLIDVAMHRQPRAAVEPITLNHRIGVNTSDAAMLQLLPGVGPGLAGNMIQHRQTSGPFLVPSDLEQVRMIGPVVRRRVEPYVRFDVNED